VIDQDGRVGSTSLGDGGSGRVSEDIERVFGEGPIGVKQGYLQLMNPDNFGIIERCLIECDLGVGLVPLDLKHIQ
jgi:hypothetical protein